MPARLRTCPFVLPLLTCAGLVASVAPIAWPSLAQAAPPPTYQVPVPAPAPPPAPSPAPAPSTHVPIPKVAIGFSKLVVRLDGRDEIGVTGLDVHVRLLERMRAQGFDAVGAENLVFGKDESHRAQFLVGGTVKTVDCWPKNQLVSCRIGVEWQVLDVAKDEVVYSVVGRGVVLNHPSDEKARVAMALLDQALDALLRRDAFRRTLAQSAETPASPAPSFPTAKLPRCPSGRKLSTSADNLLGEVVVIKNASGHGSGFLVSPEGLVMTAAHVVTGGALTLRLRDGKEVPAVPVRVSHREDVALLRTTTPLTAHACAPLRAALPSSGSDVYVAGAPVSVQLAFSLSRGIVSGFPVLDGHRRLQTDAPVSPGNSGGPVADGDGNVIGVVSFKGSGARVEGLGFAVPIPEALAALGLELGDATDAALLRETAPVAEAAKAAKVVDDADPVPSLDPEGDQALEFHRLQVEETARRQKALDELDASRFREEAAEAARRHREEAAMDADVARRTPKYVPSMRWGGLSLVGVGGFVALISSLENKSSTTQPDFDTLRTWNMVGWGAVIVGTGAFVTSFILQPSRRPLPAPPSASLVVGPGALLLRGSF